MEILCPMNYCMSCFMLFSNDDQLNESIHETERETQSIDSDDEDGFGFVKNKPKITKDINNFICLHCNSKVLYKKHQLNLHTVNENKRVHLSNLLRKFEVFKIDDYAPEIEKINLMIHKYNINPKQLDCMTIVEMLKPKSYNFITIMLLCDYFHGANFRFTEELKNNVFILFTAFIKFNSRSTHQRKNLSYEVLLYYIFKILGVDLNMKPNSDKFQNAYHQIESLREFLKEIDLNKKEFVRNDDSIILPKDTHSSFGSSLEKFLKSCR